MDLELPTTHSPFTRKQTGVIVVKTFNGELDDRYRLLAFETKDNWDGKGAKAPHDAGIALLGNVLIQVAVKDNLIDYGKSSMFCDTLGNMEVVLKFDEDIDLTFKEDSVEIYNENKHRGPETNYKFTAEEAVGYLAQLPYFSHRCIEEQHEMLPLLRNHHGDD